MKEFYSWYRGLEENIPSGSSIGSCCGSKTLKAGPRKWKNQYGEGSTEDVDPIAHNTRGILVIEGKSGKEIKEGKTLVNHINTKNGVLTVSVRRQW